jgi:DNA primase large subunit
MIQNRLPLCMSVLYRKLTLNRRKLAHHERIQLTLFLKEVGMPLHQAWSNATNQLHKFSSKAIDEVCCKKFLY